MNVKSMQIPLIWNACGKGMNKKLNNQEKKGKNTHPHFCVRTHYMKPFLTTFLKCIFVNELRAKTHNLPMLIKKHSKRSRKLRLPILKYIKELVKHTFI